jgi:hypothetical protein
MISYSTTGSGINAHDDCRHKIQLATVKWSVRLFLLERFFLLLLLSLFYLFFIYLFIYIASSAVQVICVNSGMCMSRIVISHKYLCANELKYEVQKFCVLKYVELLTSPFASL